MRWVRGSDGRTHVLSNVASAVTNGPRGKDTCNQRGALEPVRAIATYPGTLSTAPHTSGRVALTDRQCGKHPERAPNRGRTPTLGPPQHLDKQHLHPRCLIQTPVTT